MIGSFSFQQKTKIIFGVGESKKINQYLTPDKSKTILIVSDQVISKLPFFAEIVSSIESSGYTCRYFCDVEPNPSIETVNKIAVITRDNCSTVIAIGGGSVMDAGKGGAMLATNPGRIEEFLLSCGDKRKEIDNQSITLFAVPTTSGTGSEVSRAICITNNATHVKDLAFSPYLWAAYAIIDPSLMLNLPNFVTATTGLDVLGHAFETYTSTSNNAYTKVLGLEAMKLVVENLHKCIGSKDIESRSNMAFASMLGGMCLNAGCCTIGHCMSGPLTVKYGIPHGYGVGISLIPMIRYTKDVICDSYKEILDYIHPCNDVPKEEAGAEFLKIVENLFEQVGLNMQLDVEKPDYKTLLALSNEAMADAGVNVCPCPLSVEIFTEMFGMVFKS